jgi:3-hydroxymyristoyl/3-hydroxydecanoyl-(acyl carrier protein) dehydratase
MHRRLLTVPADHPSFDGHFPGYPIWPGALLLDQVLHVLETELAIDLEDWQLASAKFLQTVGPGAELTLEFEQQDDRVRYTVHDGGRAALTGVLARHGRA